MTWRNAHSLDTLRKQINAMFPNRDKRSDGTIGDAKHASRSSDHNPWIKIKENGKTIGIVTALDITHDPSVGLDSERLAEAWAASRDKRIKYIISNGKIMAGNGGPKPWVWRRYDGYNKHNRHVHISVEDTKDLYDDDEEWGFVLTTGPVAKPTTPTPPLLKKGSKGEDVKTLQKALNKKGYGLEVDGDFGPATDKAVRLFQRASGLFVDGKVGPYTWEKLNV